MRLAPALMLGYLTALLYLQSPVGSYGRERHHGNMWGQKSSEVVRRALLELSDSVDLCPHQEPGSVVEDPPVLKSKSGDLDVDFAFKTSFDANGNPKFCYITPENLQSPVLYVRNGDTLKVRLSNQVPATVNITDYGVEGRLPRNFSVCQQSADSLNPGSTNFHFHGMEVTPRCGGDQVIHVAINPGEAYEYSVTISSAVTPGNYWYHPHLTGDTEPVIQGGATGPIIVAGLENYQPAVAGLPERVFMLRDFLLPESLQNETDAPAWDISINYVPIPFADGYPPAIIYMKPNEVQVWDITNSAADTIFDLALEYDGVQQNLGIISRDGAPLRSPKGNSSQATVINQTDVVLGNAGRVQLLVQGPGANVKNATLYTQYVDTGPDGDYDPERPIASIVVNNSRIEPALRFAVNSTAQPATFQNPKQPTRNRTLYFSEVLQQPSNPNSPTTFYLTEVGDEPTAFFVYETPPIVVQQGAIEEWLVENRAVETHVFHIHQLHFTVAQANNVQSVYADSRTPYIIGQFVDTIVIPYWNGTGPYSSYRLLLDFTRVDVGDFVLHCHMAEHEDQGMTTPIRVVAAS